MFPSNRNQLINSQRKSIEWFQYDGNIDDYLDKKHVWFKSNHVYPAPMFINIVWILQNFVPNWCKYQKL